MREEGRGMSGGSFRGGELVRLLRGSNKVR